MKGIAAKNELSPQGPLHGLRVLELGHYVSAPFCTRLLADMGAEVIKVEMPGEGDPMRANGRQVKGRSLWWSSLSRNKKLITLDLRKPQGRSLVLRLAKWADVVVENFRAGQLEKWELGWDVLHSNNPGMVLMRISGFGQEGPYSDRVSFAPVAEAIGGLTYVTGGQDTKGPARPNISLGDSITGLNAFGMLLAAIYERDSGGTGKGRCIDVAMYESVFAMMDAAVSEYSALGLVRAPSANTVVFSPSGSFRAGDGGWVFITASGNAVFHRLVRAIGKSELMHDPRFLKNEDRVANRAQLAAIIEDWAAERTAREVELILNEASVPASKIYSMEDCVGDPHYQARGSILKVEDAHAGKILHPPIAAKFDEHGSQPSVRWAGAGLGAHNQEVYGDLLGVTSEDLEQMQAAGVI